MSEPSRYLHLTCWFLLTKDSSETYDWLEGSRSVPCWVVAKGLRFLDEDRKACLGLLACG